MHLVGAWLGGTSLTWLAQHQSVPCDISPAEHHHLPPHACVPHSTHTLTQEHLTHEKIYLYIHSVPVLGLT